jgi:alpha-glucoside transport system substrate-binding protein
LSKMMVTISIIALIIEGILVGHGIAGQGRIHIAVLWGGDELAAFEAMVAPFEKKTGIDIVIESVGRDLSTVLVTRFHAGNPPDMAVMPNPGQMREFVARKGLIALDRSIVADHPQAFVDLGSIEGKLYGVFIGADLKSLIWYSPKQFKARDYTIPANWGELMALSDRIVAEGKTPWCMGLESGAASGWPGTDWIEDILLRTSGPEVYDRWVNHEIEWTAPPVYRAWEYFGKIARNEKYLFGGTTGALTINFGDSPSAMFMDPPRSFLHRQATFIQGFIRKANPDLVPGRDYDIFVFPIIQHRHGNPLLGAGDLMSAFKDTTETKRLMAYLASAGAQEIWAGKIGKLGVNTRVDPAIYPDPITAKAAGILRTAKSFRFDGSDMMPAAVGSGAFWRGVLDYVSGKDLASVLNMIEKSADEAYGD